MAPPAPTLLKVRGASVELDRAQDNIQHALSGMNTSLVQYVDEEIAAIPAPIAVSSITPFGSAPNAAGGTITGTALTLQPADATNPGGVTAGNQSFGGIKTFTGQVNFNQTVVMTSTNAIWFNGVSSNAIQYAASTLTGMQFYAPHFEFHPTAAGQMFFPALVNADRYGVSIKDDQSGAPGNFTTTASAGRAAFAAGAAAVVITNNAGAQPFAATDDVYLTFIDLDATLTQMSFVAAANTITITGNAVATANCRFSWFVVR